MWGESCYSKPMFLICNQGCAWVFVNACVYSMCHFERCYLFAWGIFSDTFLVLSKHIVCEWLPVITSLELCLLPNHITTVAFSRLSHLLSFSPLPALFLSLIFYPPSFFLLSFSLSLCVLPERWYQGLQVSSFFDQFILFIFSFHFPPKAFNHKTASVYFHEIHARLGYSFYCICKTCNNQVQWLVWCLQDNSTLSHSFLNCSVLFSIYFFLHACLR